MCQMYLNLFRLTSTSPSTEETEYDGSAFNNKLLTSLMYRFTARQLCTAAIVCRRWKRVADSHPRWCELLKSTGVKVEAADVDSKNLLEISSVNSVCSTSTLPDYETTNSPSESQDWETVTAMPTGTYLEPKDCKFIYLMAMWVPSNRVEGEDGEAWQQYQEYQEYWQQATRAALSDPSGGVRSLILGGGGTKRRVIRLTLVGGAVAILAPVCINGAVSVVFSWWQQPGVMWLIRAAAERLTWGTAAAFGSLGYHHSNAAEEPPEEIAKTTTAAALAGYLSHLAFLRFL